MSGAAALRRSGLNAAAGMLFGICLTLAAAVAAAPVFFQVSEFTLAWTHSIEQVRWEEDYAVTPSADGSRALLQARKARVRGSAAGMEPPSGARLRAGWYEYVPALRNPAQLRLTRSEFTPDYDYCVAQRCQPLAKLLPSDHGVTLLEPCARSSTP